MEGLPFNLVEKGALVPVRAPSKTKSKDENDISNGHAIHRNNNNNEQKSNNIIDEEKIDPK